MVYYTLILSLEKEIGVFKFYYIEDLSFLILELILVYKLLYNWLVSNAPVLELKAVLEV
jgi:hypothetical protein